MKSSSRRIASVSPPKKRQSRLDTRFLKGKLIGAKPPGNTPEEELAMFKFDEELVGKPLDSTHVVTDTCSCTALMSKYNINATA
jgi:hypothetical protein